MVNQDQNKKQEIKSSIEKAIPPAEQPVRFRHGREGSTEKVPERTSAYEKIVSDELKREIEMMELDDKAKAEAEKKSEKIAFLGEKEKIEHLLEIAREKGVFFAVQVAKKMNEPYLLDILHDTLAREGLYRNLGQAGSDDRQTQASQPNNNSADSK